RRLGGREEELFRDAAELLEVLDDPRQLARHRLGLLERELERGEPGHTPDQLRVDFHRRIIARRGRAPALGPQRTPRDSNVVLLARTRLPTRRYPLPVPPTVRSPRDAWRSLARRREVRAAREAARELGLDAALVVGGAVRDAMLRRPHADLDLTAPPGSGRALAAAIGRRLGSSA